MTADEEDAAVAGADSTAALDREGSAGVADGATDREAGALCAVTSRESVWIVSMAASV